MRNKGRMRRAHGLSRQEFLKLSGMGFTGAALLGTVGCGGGGASGSVSAAAWNVAAEALEASVDSFNGSDSGIDVTIQTVGAGYEQITPRLQTGSGAPDIIQTQARDFPSFLRQFPDQFVDITDRLGSREDEFAETAWVSVQNEGSVWAIPWDIGPTAVWYRKDYFDEAGINPESLTTWNAFIEAGKELQQAVDGVSMTTFSFGTEMWDHWQILMNQLGGYFYGNEGRDKTTVSLVNEPNIRALEMLIRFKEEGIVVNGLSWDDRLRNVASGDTATAIYPSWYGGSIKTQAADQEGLWGAFPLPAFEEGGNQQANLGGSILTISSQSENQDAAWEFLRYTLLTNEGQQIQMGEFGLFPAWQPYYDYEPALEPDPYFGFSLVEFFGDLATDIPPLNFGAYSLEMTPIVEDALTDAFAGNVSPEEALSNAEQRIADSTDLNTASS